MTLAGATLLTPMAVALNLQLPANATLTLESVADPDSYALPIGALENGAIPTTSIEGHILRQAWQIDTASQSTLQILAPLREQLKEGGFEILLECETTSCGGFDFRFETEVITAPNMHVDLFDYRFLSARLPKDNHNEYVTLLISKSSVSGFVQLFHIAPKGSTVAQVTSDAPIKTGTPTIVQSGTSLSLGRALEKNGRAVLSDLTFKTGSSDLGDEVFTSLSTLAAYLVANPQHRVALVGHTDSQGTLAANIALSKRRAASVVERLVKSHSVSQAQVTGEGMGYLAPRASNLTQAGRNANRRVEVILLNIE